MQIAINQGKFMRLHTQILLAMAIGLVLGLIMHGYGDPDAAWFTNAIWTFDLIGKEIFIGALKMIIAPLIFASIVTGIVSLPNATELGSIGGKIFVYYFSTTAIAVLIGLVAVLVIQPGTKEASQSVRAEREAELLQHRTNFEAQTGLDSQDPESTGAYLAYIAQQEGEGISGAFQSKWNRMKSTETRGPLDMMREEIIRPILTNPFTALSQNPPNALGVIFFAMLLGICCVVIGEPAAPVGTFFTALNEVMMKITLWIMMLAPVGIAAIMASLVATLGVDVLKSLAWYCIAVLGGLALHVCFIFTLVKFFGKMSPIVFLRGIRDAWMIAFSTASSAATLPVTIHCTTEKLGVDERVSRFTLPVGATVNMDGTALYEGVAIIFLIQLFGGLDDVPIELTFGKTLVIFITAVLASIGAAAIPSAGLITMAIVANAVGLPMHYIAIIYAVDRLLDMFRTSTNVLGDAAGAVIVNRLEAKNLKSIT
jgi:Na+/H+-dicarboxylate symporter